MSFIERFLYCVVYLLGEFIIRGFTVMTYFIHIIIINVSQYRVSSRNNSLGEKKY